MLPRGSEAGRAGKSRAPAYAVISQGVAPGDVVVTSGVQALHPGQKVRLLGYDFVGAGFLVSKRPAPSSCEGLTDAQANRLLRRYPANPRPVKPTIIIAQVEGSGTGVCSVKCSAKLNPFAPFGSMPPLETRL